MYDFWRTILLSVLSLLFYPVLLLSVDHRFGGTMEHASSRASG